MTHDSADIAAVLALEAAYVAALPAIGRLVDAVYPGADFVSDMDPGEGFSLALRLFRQAAGNQAAWDLAFWGGDTERPADKAIEGLIDCHGASVETLNRALAIHRHAGMVA